MSLIIFETYCLKCGYSFVNEEDVAEEEDVILLECNVCGHPQYLHRCGKGRYSKMGMREVKDGEVQS